MLRGIALTELYRQHIEGNPDRALIGCSQCSDADSHLLKVIPFCDAGRELAGGARTAAAQAWYHLAKSRRDAGQRARKVPGHFSIEVIEAEIRYFYDNEFQGVIVPRGGQRSKMVPLYEVLSSKSLWDAAFSGAELEEESVPKPDPVSGLRRRPAPMRR